MSDKYLHIVSFDSPFPPDYGGVIDVYFRIKALALQGVKVILHCYEYGRGRATVSDSYCHEIHYYDRRKNPFLLLSKLPYIVVSRQNPELLARLLNDQYPILLEGMHCAGILADLKKNGRTVFVRTHNIEGDYYAGLAKVSSGLKRMYFQMESRKLYAYDQQLQLADHLFCIHAADSAYFAERGCTTSVLMPSLDLEATRVVDPSAGKRFLYHGNLSVPENARAVRYFLRFWSEYHVEFPLLISGKCPNSDLAAQIESTPNVQLLADPTEEQMVEAQVNNPIHLFYTEQATGVKLKLVRSIQMRAICIVNQAMVEGTDLAADCILANDYERLAEVLASRIAFPEGGGEKLSVAYKQQISAMIQLLFKP